MVQCRYCRVESEFFICEECQKTLPKRPLLFTRYPDPLVADVADVAAVMAPLPVKRGPGRPRKNG